jgi:hypothetical protein
VAAEALSLGVQGAQPPAPLDTMGIRSESEVPSPASATGCAGIKLESGETRYHVRCTPGPEGRRCVPVRHLPRWSMSWREMVEAIARDLERRGAKETAESLRGCGRRSWSTDCRNCGANPARILVRVACDLRVCVWCGRRLATKRTKQLTAAMEAAPQIAFREAVGVIEGLMVKRDEAARIAHNWTEKASTWRAKAARLEQTGSARRLAKCLASIERATRYATRADERFRRAKRWIQQAKNRRSWRWRFLTLTHWWDPSDPREWTVAAMAKRVKALWRQWSALWREIGVGGLAAATAKIEISDLGHIHLHALYWGPWVVQKARQASGKRAPRARDEDTAREHRARRWLTRVQAKVNPLAGHTHVRGTDDKVAKEAAKYTAKAPTPMTPEFIAGQRRKVMNPRAAAAYQLASSKVQLVRHYGTMREAIPDDEDADDDDAHRKCCECGFDLGPVSMWNHDWTDAVARQQRSKWRRALEVRND